MPTVVSLVHSKEECHWTQKCLITVIHFFAAGFNLFRCCFPSLYHTEIKCVLHRSTCCIQLPIPEKQVLDILLTFWHASHFAKEQQSFDISVTKIIHQPATEAEDVPLASLKSMGNRGFPQLSLFWMQTVPVKRQGKENTPCCLFSLRVAPKPLCTFNSSVTG